MSPLKFFNSLHNMAKDISAADLKHLSLCLIPPYISIFFHFTHFMCGCKKKKKEKITVNNFPAVPLHCPFPQRLITRDQLKGFESGFTVNTFLNLTPKEQFEMSVYTVLASLLLILDSTQQGHSCLPVFNTLCEKYLVSSHQV